MVPDAAAVLTLRPATLAAHLDALDRRLGPGADALGPLGAAWIRARQTVEDALADLLEGRGAAPSLLARWGVDPDAPLVFSVGAPDGPALGRALLATLRGDAPPTPAAVAWRGRLSFRVDDAALVRRWAEAAGARLGLAAQPPADATITWQGASPQSGARLLLRVAGDRGALDWIAPPRPDAPAAALLHDHDRRAPAPPPGDAPLRLTLSPAGVAALETALDAAPALARAADLPRGRRAPLLTAAAEVTAACGARWAEVARLADVVSIDLRLPDGRPRLTVEAALTAAGEAAWTDAQRGLPLRDLDGVPLGLAVGLDGARFVPGDGPAWADDAARCRAGHPILVAALTLPLLPAFAAPTHLPVPAPPGGFPPATDGVASLLWGFAPGPEPVPLVAGVVTLPGAPPEAPPAFAALADPLPTALGAGWRRAGPVPVELARGPRPGGGGVIVYALGAGGVDRLTPRLGPAGASAPFLLVRLDAAALARDLEALGARSPEQAALAAVGERLGALRAKGTRVGRRLRVRLAPELPEPARARPPGALDGAQAPRSRRGRTVWRHRQPARSAPRRRTADALDCRTVGGPSPCLRTPQPSRAPRAADTGVIAVCDHDRGARRSGNRTPLDRPPPAQ